jgi:hypothetical protein
MQSVYATEHNTEHNFATEATVEKTSSDNLRISAKKLSSEHDLDLYFKPRPNANFCNHAVAVVAATAAVVAAVSSVIAASKGRSLDSSHPINLEDDPMTKLNVQELMNIRSNGL